MYSLPILLTLLFYYYMCLYTYVLSLFFKDFFRAVLGSQQNWEEGTEVSIYPLPQHMITSPNISILRHSGTFLTMDEPALTRHNHPKSTVYIKIHSWGCKFYGFGEMYNVICSSLWYHTEYFHCPKNPVLCLFRPRPQPHPWLSWIFLPSL